MKYKVLLPTDFSGNAFSAIEYALKLFANESCTFYLQHSWSFTNSTTRTYITTHYINELKEESNKQLVKLKNQVEIANRNKKHSFQVIFSEESLLDALKINIEKQKIDLVVMDTKGASKNKEFFFGSNTVHIINNMKLCPVIIVPDKFDFVEPSQIAFPTDFNRFYGEELLPLNV